MLPSCASALTQSTAQEAPSLYTQARLARQEIRSLPNTCDSLNLQPFPGHAAALGFTAANAVLPHPTTKPSGYKRTPPSKPSMCSQCNRQFTVTSGPEPKISPPSILQQRTRHRAQRRWAQYSQRTTLPPHMHAPDQPRATPIHPQLQPPEIFAHSSSP